MQTKFILHGGFSPLAQEDKQQNDQFFQEILKDVPDNAKILLVYFAVREERVQFRIEQDKEEFEKNKGSRNLHFRVASLAAFADDCAWADAIYLHGGKTEKLMESLSKYSNIRQILSGRTIAGDSAGANVLARVFYSKDSKVIGRGLGILPLKIVVHYEDGTPNPLINVEPELETLLLHEYEFKVV